jgi:signal transduction histidine kinase
MKSPTIPLVAGLAFTLLVIGGYAFYTLRSVGRMREVQTSIVDRNRMGSLQLIRIQNELNSLGLSMRDMLDESQGYPLEAWAAPLSRVRENLEDAIAREAGLSRRSSQAILTAAFADFWRSSDAAIALARQGERTKALEMVRGTLQPRLEALSSQTARLLVSNNEEESKAGEQVRELYAEIERSAYLLLAVSLALILLTSVGLIRSNRRLFAQLSTLAEQRRELAQQLISTQESTFRAISRDLHDEFGQILTALGAVLRRAQKHAPDSTFHEASVVVQGTLEKIRSLSQSLQPVILDEQGLVAAVAWHIAGFERHTGISVKYRGPEGATEVDLPAMKAVHVFRILQEAMNNAAKHAGVTELEVRLECRAVPRVNAGPGIKGVLSLSVIDEGRGLTATRSDGVGLAGMRERAALLGGTLTIEPALASGRGTCVSVQIPLAVEPAVETEVSSHGSH